MITKATCLLIVSFYEEIEKVERILNLTEKENQKNPVQMHLVINGPEKVDIPADLSYDLLHQYLHTKEEELQELMERAKKELEITDPDSEQLIIKQLSMEEKWITRDDAMRFLDYGATQMATFMKKVKTCKIGKRIFILRQSLDEYMESMLCIAVPSDKSKPIG